MLTSKASDCMLEDQDEAPETIVPPADAQWLAGVSRMAKAEARLRRTPTHRFTIRSKKMQGRGHDVRGAEDQASCRSAAPA